MKTVGVIVEYNPFHNGHKWHLEAAKRLSGCPFAIGVMSGNFVQRGEPALFDKWIRAEMAVRAGVDLVIELPTMFAVRSAQHFAAGAIRLLKSLRVVTHVCFGAEHADSKMLQSAALVTTNSHFPLKLRDQLNLGYSYAAALGRIMQAECQIDAAVLMSPNNILAIEYLRAIAAFAPDLVPIIIERQQSNYHDTAITTALSSATAIRQAIVNDSSTEATLNMTLPATNVAIVQSCLRDLRGPVIMDAFSGIVLSKLRTAALSSLEQLPYVTEGLENKIYDCAMQATTLEDFFSLLKSKRYTRTRLQRIIIHAMLGLNKNDLIWADDIGPLYARVLAFNQQGRKLLKLMAGTTDVPIITKTTAFLNSKQRCSISNLTPLQTMLAVDTLASDLYVLGMPKSQWNAGGWDFRYSPVYIPGPRG